MGRLYATATHHTRRSASGIPIRNVMPVCRSDRISGILGDPDVKGRNDQYDHAKQNTPRPLRQLQ